MPESYFRTVTPLSTQCGVGRSVEVSLHNGPNPVRPM